MTVRGLSRDRSQNTSAPEATRVVRPGPQVPRVSSSADRVGALRFGAGRVAADAQLGCAVEAAPGAFTIAALFDGVDGVVIVVPVPVAFAFAATFRVCPSSNGRAQGCESDRSPRRRTLRRECERYDPSPESPPSNDRPRARDFGQTPKPRDVRDVEQRSQRHARLLHARERHERLLHRTAFRR